MSKKNWTHEHLLQTIAEVQYRKTIKGSARKYGMSEAIVLYKMKVYWVKWKIKQSGWLIILSKEEEKQLDLCIRTMCRVGFSPTKEQIKDIVQEYVHLHQLNTSFENYCPIMYSIKDLIYREIFFSYSGCDFQLFTIVLSYFKELFVVELLRF